MTPKNILKIGIAVSYLTASTMAKAQEDAGSAAAHEILSIQEPSQRTERLEQMVSTMSPGQATEVANGLRERIASLKKNASDMEEKLKAGSGKIAYSRVARAIEVLSFIGSVFSTYKMGQHQALFAKMETAIEVEKKQTLESPAFAKQQAELVELNNELVAAKEAVEIKLQGMRGAVNSNPALAAEGLRERLAEAKKLPNKKGPNAYSRIKQKAVPEVRDYITALEKVEALEAKINSHTTPAKPFLPETTASAKTAIDSKGAASEHSGKARNWAYLGGALIAVTVLLEGYISNLDGDISVAELAESQRTAMLSEVQKLQLMIDRLDSKVQGATDEATPVTSSESSENEKAETPVPPAAEAAETATAS